MKLVDLLEACECKDRFVQKQLDFFGIPISIELIPGSIKYSTTHDGKPWSRKMYCDYGYIDNVIGADNEELDCYVKDCDSKSTNVYVVHQLTKDGKAFDEDKVLFGFESEQEAIDMWKAHAYDSDLMYGGCSTFDMEFFKDIIQSIKIIRNSYKDKIGIMHLDQANDLHSKEIIAPCGNCAELVEAASPIVPLNIKAADSRDYFEAMFSLPYMTHHKMSDRAKQIFNQIFKKNKK